MSDTKKETMFAKLARRHESAASNAVAAVDPPSAPIRARTDLAAGKRANPDYCQANAYVPKTVRKDVERALLDVDGLDYSSLITDLLRQWLKSRGAAE